MSVPFRYEENPSFSIHADDRRWKDFPTGEKSGDVFDFYMKAKGCDRKTAFLELKAMLDGGTVAAALASIPKIFIPALYNKNTYLRHTSDQNERQFDHPALAQTHQPQLKNLRQ